jgi:hypothetical protein
MSPFANPASFMRYSDADVASMNATGIADCGGGHYYSGGANVDCDNWNHSLTWASPGGFLAGSKRITGEKPIYMGEAGYHNLTGYQQHGDPGVSERASSIYIPLIYCEGFRQLPAGSRCYIYELADDKPDPGSTNPEFNYGAFLRNDGFRKSAFNAVKNLISIVHDPRPTAAFTPGQLNVTIAAAADTMHHMLLQKSNGDYYLLLWNDVSVYKSATAAAPGEDVHPSTVPVTLTFARNCRVVTYSPSDPTGASPTTAYSVRTTARSISLQVPAELLVVKISND